MTAYLPHPPQLYDSQNASSHDYYQAYPDAYSCQLSHGYAFSEDPSADHFTTTHGISASAVASNQVPTSHPLYGDADSAVIRYATDHGSQSGDEWVQPSHPSLQTRFHERLQPRAFYEPGEISPGSDDSSGVYGGSPQPYAHALSEGRAYPSTYDNGYPQNYFGNKSSETGTTELPYEQGSLGGYGPSYEYGQISPVSREDEEGCDNYQLCGGYIRQRSHPIHSRDSVDYRQRCASARLATGHALVQPPIRSQSPMGHLPYHDPETYGGIAGPPVHRYHSPLSSSSEFSDGSLSNVEHPQAVYPSYTSQQPTYPTPIAIPAPRSPPLVEDAPKKPLTLACFFCRKRKIACGSPSSGKKDRTCNQCARRNLQCVYPVNSRRGTRQRELEAAYPA